MYAELKAFLHSLYFSLEGNCVSKRDAKDGKRLLGAFTLQCDDSGDYKKKQCHGSTGYCWCVNSKTGVEISGTKQRGLLDCGKNLFCY